MSKSELIAMIATLSPAQRRLAHDLLTRREGRAQFPTMRKLVESGIGEWRYRRTKAGRVRMTFVAVTDDAWYASRQGAA